VAELIRRFGISKHTLYRWKREYATFESDQMLEFTQISEENARLKKFAAELSLDEAVLQDVLSKTLPGQRS
jgi:putative transposase